MTYNEYRAFDVAVCNYISNNPVILNGKPLKGRYTVFDSDPTAVSVWFFLDTFNLTADDLGLIQLDMIYCNSIEEFIVEYHKQVNPREDVLLE